MPDTIPCSVDGLSLRRRLGRSDWGVPEPFGSDGWVVDHKR
ncbi:MAG: hypothetical protein JWO46_1824, partial [Nocardioidaceae bacterium]|nr:hypothetical protein [Nocardioidaceae bacterium]